MRRTVTRVLAAMAAGAALSSLGLTGASASGPAAGAQLWASRYTGVAGGGGHAAAMAVSPGGRRVFVAGDSCAAPSDSDYAAVAYNAATGARLWVSRYSGPANGDAAPARWPSARAGRPSIVTGTAGHRADYATVAYNAATGARRWVSRYNGPAQRSDDLPPRWPSARAGQTVFVTGTSSAAPRAGTTPRSPTTPPPAPSGGPAATTATAARQRQRGGGQPGRERRCSSPGPASTGTSTTTPRSPTTPPPAPSGGPAATAAPSATDPPAPWPSARAGQTVFVTGDQPRRHLRA